MNSHKFFHRDIKASNIFFASDGSFRLGDYGISASIKKGGNDSYVGSLCCLVPEVAMGMSYDYKVDIKYKDEKYCEIIGFAEIEK